MVSESFEPEIVAFCCHHCAYAGADLAGSMRLNYPANIKIVRLPCSGTVDVLYILRAFERGADGVMVAGWLEGTCHYLEGNVRAKRKVNYAKELLKRVGLEPERLIMVNMSSADGALFAEVTRQMTSDVKELGPSPVRRSLAK